jgi:hypothetical protein
LEDVRQFLSILHAYRILPYEALEGHQFQTTEPKATPNTTQESTFLEIGGLRIALYDANAFLTPPLQAFACANQHDHAQEAADISVYCHGLRPSTALRGKVLVRNRDLIVLYDQKTYILLYPASEGLVECHINRQENRADVYARYPIDENTAMQFLYALRSVYLIFARDRRLFAIHSASILYDDKAWLFSARSKTGKSTLAAHCSRLFDTPILNGDVNLIGRNKDGFLVHGIPWCGTSGQFCVERYPLGGIVLLKQGQTNQVIARSLDENAVRLTQRMISPDWTYGMAKSNLSFAKELAGSIPVLSLSCTKDQEAAVVLKAAIDEKIR